MKSRVRTWFTLFLVATAAIFSGLAVWMIQLEHEIQIRFEKGRFAPPVEFYTAPQVIRRGHSMDSNALIQRFRRLGYRSRNFGETLQEKDYSFWPGQDCRSALPFSKIEQTPQKATVSADATDSLDSSISHCLAFRHSRDQIFRAGFFLGESLTTTDASGSATEPVQILVFNSLHQVIGIFSGINPRPTESGVLIPELFAQYLGAQPILRQETAFNAVPSSCKWAVLAIEDPHFLDHGGISAASILRAAWANLKAGRFAQGGSTITQQLVKNYFLTQEKTLSRKLKEFAMALILESRISKEKILETYLNLIYMGQSGAFEVRGFGAASLHLFNRPLESLTLHECALLAAVLNSPGTYNPFTYPDRSLQRRNRVLEKMQQHGFIDADSVRSALSKPLPTSESSVTFETAPYFVKTARAELLRLGIDPSNGLKVFTTLNTEHQEAAQRAVADGLKRLEARPNTKPLEAALISADPQTGFITAVVGGRGYIQTQFNRATEAFRQVGSLMKPIVYASALEQLRAEDLDQDARSGRFDTVTLISDSPLTVKYDGQSWSPRNYDGKSRGLVPAWYALAHSLNQATAWLAQQLGPKKIIETSRALGVKAHLEAVPSIALGAFEMAPIEMLNVYVVFARMGSQIPLSTLLRVEDLNGNELHSFRSTEDQVLESDSAALVVSMLEQAVRQGTAKLAANRLIAPAAGKTGTTNEKKDSWFAGFSAETVAVVWVGTDDNQPTGLTGASGALPIWIDFMSQSSAFKEKNSPRPHFNFPEGVQLRRLSVEELLKWSSLEPKPSADTELLVRSNARDSDSY